MRRVKNIDKVAQWVIENGTCTGKDSVVDANEFLVCTMDSDGLEAHGLLYDEIESEHMINETLPQDSREQNYYRCNLKEFTNNFPHLGKAIGEQNG